MKHILKSSRNVIIHLHGAEYLNFYQKLRKCGRKVIKAFFDNAKVVLVLSDYWKRALDEKIGVESNCYVLRNCALSENMICPSRNDFSHEMVFLFLGRIGTRKGTFDLIRAFEYALKEEWNKVPVERRDELMHMIRDVVGKCPEWYEREMRHKCRTDKCNLQP